jgi:hypothetical protein
MVSFSTTRINQMVITLCVSVTYSHTLQYARIIVWDLTKTLCFYLVLSVSILYTGLYIS